MVLNHNIDSSGNMDVTCMVENVYPEPTIHLLWNERCVPFILLAAVLKVLNPISLDGNVYGLSNENKPSSLRHFMSKMGGGPNPVATEIHYFESATHLFLNNNVDS